MGASHQVRKGDYSVIGNESERNVKGYWYQLWAQKVNGDIIKVKLRRVVSHITQISGAVEFVQE